MQTRDGWSSRSLSVGYLIIIGHSSTAVLSAVLRTLVASPTYTPPINLSSEVTTRQLQPQLTVKWAEAYLELQNCGDLKLPIICWHLPRLAFAEHGTLRHRLFPLGAVTPVLVPESNSLQTYLDHLLPPLVQDWKSLDRFVLGLERNVMLVSITLLPTL